MAKAAVKEKTSPPATVASSAPARISDAPDYMKKYGAVGTEKIDASSVETPRLILLQALSPEVEKFGVKMGEYWHSVLEKSLGSSVAVVPVYVEKTAVLWRPRPQGGGILARQQGDRWVPSNTKFEVVQGGKTVIWDTKSTIAESRLLEWGTSVPGDARSLPAATQTINFVFVLPDHPEASPVLMSFSKTAIKPANKILSQLKMSGMPSFGMKFTLSVDKAQNAKGNFFTPKFTLNGLTSEADCEEYYKMYQIFANKERSIGVAEPDDHEGDDVANEGRF